jgi:septum site-determining protein MinC
MSEPHADPSSPSVAAQAGALRAPARPAAEFKGLSHPALRLVLNEADTDALAAALDVLLGVDDDEAFEWQPVVVDASRVAEAEALALSWIVERPVRSGQQVYARGGDLVVIGDVSPGAEVIADGNVHVYGTLGGRAIAGARGRRDAGIFTLDLRAELVAVCGIYRTFEDGPPAAQAGKPVRISLEADADTLSLRTL